MYGKRSMRCRISSPVSGTRAKTKTISTVGMDEHAFREVISAGTMSSSKLYRTGCMPGHMH